MVIDNGQHGKRNFVWITALQVTKTLPPSKKNVCRTLNWFSYNGTMKNGSNQFSSFLFFGLWRPLLTRWFFPIRGRSSIFGSLLRKSEIYQKCWEAFETNCFPMEVVVNAGSNLRILTKIYVKFILYHRCYYSIYHFITKCSLQNFFHPMFSRIKRIFYYCLLFVLCMQQIHKMNNSFLSHLM